MYELKIVCLFVSSSSRIISTAPLRNNLATGNRELGGGRGGKKDTHYCLDLDRFVWTMTWHTAYQLFTSTFYDNLVMRVKYQLSLKRNKTTSNPVIGELTDHFTVALLWSYHLLENKNTQLFWNYLINEFLSLQNGGTCPPPLPRCHFWTHHVA